MVILKMPKYQLPANTVSATGDEVADVHSNVPGDHS